MKFATTEELHERLGQIAIECGFPPGFTVQAISPDQVVVAQSPNLDFEAGAQAFECLQKQQVKLPSVSFGFLGNEVAVEDSVK